jgi:hypothetical protein
MSVVSKGPEDASPTLVASASKRKNSGSIVNTELSYKSLKCKIFGRGAIAVPARDPEERVEDYRSRLSPDNIYTRPPVMAISFIFYTKAILYELAYIIIKYIHLSRRVRWGRVCGHSGASNHACAKRLANAGRRIPGVDSAAVKAGSCAGVCGQNTHGTKVPPTVLLPFELLTWNEAARMMHAAPKEGSHASYV